MYLLIIDNKILENNSKLGIKASMSNDSQIMWLCVWDVLSLSTRNAKGKLHMCGPQHLWLPYEYWFYFLQQVSSHELIML